MSKVCRAGFVNFCSTNCISNPPFSMMKMLAIGQEREIQRNIHEKLTMKS
ncbi:hypothetical protein [Ectobacillus panaciterrae]|nr:hypothetical protein [Ectobacillus panaciterrae]